MFHVAPSDLIPPAWGLSCRCAPCHVSSRIFPLQSRDTNKKGSALWLRGEKAHMIYIVMSGELQEVEKDNLENQIGKSLVVQIHDAQRMLKNSGDSASDGEPRVLKKYTAGSTVGLDSLFLKGYRQATMIVREPVSLWAINRVTYQATVIKRKRPDVPSELGAYLACCCSVALCGEERGTAGKDVRNVE